jgi:hypothetical protein
MVAGLGAAWILDGLQITISSSVTGVLIQPDTLDMDCALRNVPAADALHRQIGQVGGEKHVVLAKRCAEQ